MITIHRTHQGTFWQVETSPPPIDHTIYKNKKELVRFAVQSFDFLLTRGLNFSGEEFAAMIEGYCEHPKAADLAEVLRTL